MGIENESPAKLVVIANQDKDGDGFKDLKPGEFGLFRGTYFCRTPNGVVCDLRANPWTQEATGEVSFTHPIDAITCDGAERFMLRKNVWTDMGVLDWTVKSV